MVYDLLHLNYFEAASSQDGVFLLPVVTTEFIFPNVKFPGDIDLLCIPYEGNQLLIDKIEAFEFKIVRAKFAKQGKSPNEFGFSQAKALAKLGFPYVTLVHLIVSDESPPEHFKKMLECKIIDDQGRAEVMGEVWVDTLPYSLIDRGFGRLLANCDQPNLGLACAYLETNEKDRKGMWLPDARQASLNPNCDLGRMQFVVNFFERNALAFLRNPAKDAT